MDTPPIITSQADLETLWRTLMSPLGFARDSLWFFFLDEDGVACTPITQIEDADEPPSADELEQLATFLAHVVGDLSFAARVAFLRSRPGRGAVTADDLAWAAALYDACRRAGLPCEVVHLATDDDVHPLPLDALPVSA